MSKHTVYGISCAHYIPDVIGIPTGSGPGFFLVPRRRLDNSCFKPAVVNLVGLSLPNLLGVDCRAAGLGEGTTPWKHPPGAPSPPGVQ